MQKIHSFFLTRAAVTLLFAMLTTASAWAQDYPSLDLEQDNEQNYLIQSVNDWNTLAEYVAAGKNTSEMTFIMTNNIGTAQEPVTRPLGQQVGTDKNNDRMRFAGTFDGGNHTLTIALNTNDEWWSFNKGYCSPFAYTVDATIKNLHVAGSVTTEGPWASGLVGSTGNDFVGTVTIDKCQVSVAIIANYVSDTTNNKYGNHGGFVGIAEGSATITDSWFDGKFLGKDYMYSAGFIGINKGKKTVLNNCLFNPSEINIENNKIEGSCEFVHSLNGGKHTLTDAYWVSHFGDPENAQGRKVVASLSEDFNSTNLSQDLSYYVYTINSAADGNPYYVILHNPKWEDLKADLYYGRTIQQLTKSITAGTDDEVLVVPTGVTAALSFNEDGAINRDLVLGDAKANGYVIKVEAGATLTLNGGTITGGNNTGDCGGIYNEGTLILNGTTITENAATGKGGGIYNAGTLTINGVTITGNMGKSASSKGVGVYAAANSTVNVKGNVQIHDNNYTYYPSTAVHVAHNFYREEGVVMTIAGALQNGSSIGVEGAEGVYTNGLSNNGDVSMFACDDPNNFFIYATDGGEVYLSAPVALSLADNAANSQNLTNGYRANVTLTGRTLYKDGLWNTICLPFDVTLQGSPLQGATVMALNANQSKLEDGTLTLTFKSESKTMKAGTPYIIKWTTTDDPIENPVFNNVLIDDTKRDVSFNGGKFVGTFDYTAYTEENQNILFLGVGKDEQDQDVSMLYYPEANASIGACRAYFDLTNASAVRSYSLVFDDEPDGIKDMKSDGVKNESAKAGWYDLSGRQLDKQPTQRGIYVHNGKKTVIK